MNANRVYVFDRTNHDAVVAGVTHQLKFVLFPAENALFEKHFVGWASLQPGTCDTTQVGLVVGEARTEPTHGERWANHHRVTKFLGTREHIIHVVSNV